MNEHYFFCNSGLGIEALVIKKYKENGRRNFLGYLRATFSATSAFKYKNFNVEIDDNSKTVTRNGDKILLTATEYRLLIYLLSNKGRVLSRVDILEQVWDINFNLGTNVVDVYINYLRKKIDVGYEPKLIHTVVGMGYILKEE